jgi:NodT family efflux transporter outer membrane factor (OMF) lipoprotein
MGLADWRGATVMMAVGLGMILSGCASKSPAPERSEARLPETFRASGDGDRPQHWWRHFNDPALNRIVTQVLDDNFSLAAARDRLTQARAEARRLQGDELPSVDASAEASSETDYRTEAMAAYELDLWGRLEATTRAAELEARATRRDLQAARITLTAEAATTYYGIRREQALAELLREQRRTNQRILDLVTLRFKNGQAASDEILRQRQLIEETDTALAAVEGRIERLRAELAALMGLAGPQALALPDARGAPDLPDQPATGLPAQWLQRRPDLAAAFLRVRSADAELAAAIAERYPQIDLTASVTSAAVSPGDLFEEWVSEIAASLSIPLFRGGSIEAAIDRSEAARAEAFNDYAQTVLDAVAAVETALTDERTQRRRLASLDRRVRQGEQIREQLRYRYSQGDANFLNVLEAQDQLQADERQRLEARWSLVTERIALLRELAGGWPVDAHAASTR